MTDFYHDDPVEEPVVKRAKPKAIFGSALLLLAGGLFLNTTLAANISLPFTLIDNFFNGDISFTYTLSEYS